MRKGKVTNNGSLNFVKKKYKKKLSLETKSTPFNG